MVTFKAGENKAMLKVTLLPEQNSKETEDLYFRVVLEKNESDAKLGDLCVQKIKIEASANDAA